jgi:hypothetical protein
MTGRVTNRVTDRATNRVTDRATDRLTDRRHPESVEGPPRSPSFGRSLDKLGMTGGG